MPETNAFLERIRSVAHEYNRSAPGADTDILASSILPDATCVAFRVTVALGAASKLDVRVTDGTNPFSLTLNDDTALKASCLYTFVFAVRRTSAADGATNLTYNFRVKTDVAVNLLFVEAVEGAQV